jgi:predicted 2-oxoglutarate/Fe(II)-dependent dioxygenase YbiX
VVPLSSATIVKNSADTAAGKADTGPEAAKSPKDRKSSVADDLQKNLQKELQSKVSKYRKETYSAATGAKLALQAE